MSAMSRSERYRNEAKRAGLWAALCLTIALTAAVFAHLARLNEMAGIMALLAFVALGCIVAACIKIGEAHGKLRDADREAYWEHRRYMDQFSHVERI